MKLPTFANAAVACCLALASAGCCCAPPSCGGITSHEIAAAAPCDSACGSACGAPVGPCLSCGVNGPCPKHHGSVGLLGYLHQFVCCSSGCGEFYVHPWINDPPAPCDPCDDHGNYIGPHPCGPASCGPGGCPVSIHNLWGYRSDLAHCGPGVAHAAYGGPYDGQVIEGPVIEGPIHRIPTMAEPQTMPADEEVEGEELPPQPPTLPGPKTSGTPKTRSALKKVDGRPAVYYSRRPAGTR